LNVLVYAPTADRVARVQDRYPEYADAEAFVREMDSQAAKYMLEHYESEWLGAGLYSYDLCVNTSTGLQASAAVINAELMRAEENCTRIAEELSPCHLPPHP
jgi:cytidylate kinase